MFEKRNNESFSLEVLEWTNCYDWWSSDKQAAEQQIILSFWISLHAHPAIHGYSFIINTNIQVYSEKIIVILKSCTTYKIMYNNCLVKLLLCYISW